MGVAALVEVVAEFAGELGGGELLRLVEAVGRDFPSVAPPFDDGVEVLELHRLRLGEVEVALGHVEAVEPGLGSWAGAVEEEDVGGDGGVGGEDAGGKADDGVEVEFGEEFLLDVDLGVVGAEEKAVGEDDGGAAAGLEAVHDDGHEEVGGLGAGEVGGEMALDVGLFAAAVGRIHEDDVEAVVVGVVEDVSKEGVGVEDLGDVEVVEEHVGDAEHVGELLLLDAVDGGAVFLAVLRRLDLRFELLEPARDEAAGAAGEVGHRLADLRGDHLRHEIGDGAGRVELACGARALKLLEDRLVDFAEGVALLVVGEVEVVDHVHDLAEEDAVLHVVVGVGEGGLHDGLADGRGGGDGQFLQRGEEGVVDEVEEPVAGHGGAGAVVGGPVRPAARLGDDGIVAVVVPFPVFLLGVVHLQEEHPRDLLDALGVAVDARVVAHDVAQTLHESG